MSILNSNLPYAEILSSLKRTVFNNNPYAMAKTALHSVGSEMSPMLKSTLGGKVGGINPYRGSMLPGFAGSLAGAAYGWGSADNDSGVIGKMGRALGFSMVGGFSGSLARSGYRGGRLAYLRSARKAARL
jgi:hypothetical protein